MTNLESGYKKDYFCLRRETVDDIQQNDTQNNDIQHYGLDFDAKRKH